MDWPVVYRNRYLAMAEMAKGILAAEGISSVVRARDPFGAFTRGPHLGTYQPTPCSVYEVRVPENRAVRASELLEGLPQDKEGGDG